MMTTFEENEHLFVSRTINLHENNHLIAVPSLLKERLAFIIEFHVWYRYTRSI